MMGGRKKMEDTASYKVIVAALKYNEFTINDLHDDLKSINQGSVGSVISKLLKAQIIEQKNQGSNPRRFVFKHNPRLEPRAYHDIVSNLASIEKYGRPLKGHLPQEQHEVTAGSITADKLGDGSIESIPDVGEPSPIPNVTLDLSKLVRVVASVNGTTHYYGDAALPGIGKITFDLFVEVKKQPPNLTAGEFNRSE